MTVEPGIIPDYLHTIADFVYNARLADLTRDAIERCRWVIADSLAVIAAGMQVKEMKFLTARHLATAAPGNAWVIGTGRRAAALDAALLNGIAGAWLELAEGNSYAVGHPGIQVLPAAIARAQEIGASGAELLLAVALGYEVSARIGRASKRRVAIHSHGTWGVIGAAVAVGRLCGLAQPAMQELINVSATMGMATSFRTVLDGATVRNIYTGHSGFMGLMAVRLVEAGFTGEMDGVRSIYSNVLADGFDPDMVVADLGHEWMIADGYFKLHPTGRYVHSAIDALEAALAKVPDGRIDADNVECIVVRTYNWAAMLAKKKVATSFGARFSIPFAVATIVYHGRTGLDCFDDSAVTNPKVQALAARVEVEEDSAYTTAYPREQNCDVRILLKDGVTLEGHCTVMKGQRSNPHKLEELERKFFGLGTPIWGETVARRLFRGCMGIEDIPDFGAFSAEFDL